MCVDEANFPDVTGITDVHTEPRKKGAALVHREEEPGWQAGPGSPALRLRLTHLQLIGKSSCHPSSPNTVLGVLGTGELPRRDSRHRQAAGLLLRSPVDHGIEPSCHTCFWLIFSLEDTRSHA